MSRIERRMQHIDLCMQTRANTTHANIALICAWMYIGMLKYFYLQQLVTYGKLVASSDSTSDHLHPACVRTY